MQARWTRPACTSSSSAASSGSSRGALLGECRCGAAALRHLPGQPPPLRGQGDGPSRRRRETDPHGGEDASPDALRPDLPVACAALLPPRSPDLLFGFESDPAISNVISSVSRRKTPELAKQGVLMRKFGQEIIKATAGKKIHGTGAIPGGMNKNLSIEERDAPAEDVDQMVEWARGAVKRRARTTPSRTWRGQEFANFDSPTCRSSARTARSTSTTACCARSTGRQHHLRPG
jgi:hypothetical protein